jgi:hypothetical protein
MQLVARNQINIICERTITIKFFQIKEYTFLWKVYRSWKYDPIVSSQMSPKSDLHLQNILWATFQIEKEKRERERERERKR